MKVLGISSNYHDASVALVENGEVKFSAAEERYSRFKHDPRFPLGALRACSRITGVSFRELDWVVCHEDPYNRITRSMASTLERWPQSLKSFLASADDAVKSGFRQHSFASEKLGIDPRRIVFVPHHVSHAALSFLSSPFEEATVITIDAVGEWMCSGIFHGKRNNGGFSLEPVELVSFPNSLGLFYSAITAYLGFPVNEGECSTMALAGFGKKSFVKEMEKVLRINSDGRYELDLSFFDFRSETELPLSGKFIKLFGEAREARAKWSFDCFNDENLASPEEQRFADMAASAQYLVEEAICSYAKRAKRLVPSDNLCYSGGVALNCVANEKLRTSMTFHSLFIPADPGDGGAAQGCALFVSALKNPEFAKIKPPKACYGENIDSGEVEKLLPHLETKNWKHFSLLPLPSPPPKIHWKKYTDFSELVEKAAESLDTGKIVGWMQGRFENGPRALGGRSLLFRADQPQLAQRVSRLIKKRAKFRPYALSMTEIEAAEFFEQREDFPSSWMQYSRKVQPEKRAKFQSGCHRDGTTRVQVVQKEEFPEFYQLLQAFGKRSGSEVLINTSFNESGMPLVNTGIDGLLCFARTDLDVLVIGNLWIEKVRNQ